MSIILGGKKLEIPGLHTVSWLDGEPRIKYISHKNNRTQWIRSIVAHTHKGISGNLLPGVGADDNIALVNAKYQVDTDRQVSWDFTISQTGTCFVQNDVTKNYSWQATNVNPITFGFEMIQCNNGDLYEGQVEKAVLFVDWMTAILGIQRQIPWDTTNDKPCVGVIKRLLSFEAGGMNGVNFVGLYGHRNQTSNRGPGDPGDWLFKALKNAGYETFDFQKNEDIKVWTARQKTVLGFNNHDSDGIPGKQTVAAIRSRLGNKFGLWIHRPVDDLLEDVT